MSPSTAIVVLLFLLGVVITHSQVSDPCKNYKTIDNPYRSTNYSINPGDPALCDSNLVAGWYRFINEVGGKMPETAPDPYHCGTVAPMWIRGTHPDVANTEKIVELCTNIRGRNKGCSLQPQDLSVKNCGSYFVYKLFRTYGCSMAYCAGNSLFLESFPKTLETKPKVL